MKLSRFLQNIMSNFPIGHKLSCLATSQLSEVLRAEWRRDNTYIAQVCEAWDLDPMAYLIEND